MRYAQYTAWPFHYHGDEPLYSSKLDSYFCIILVNVPTSCCFSVVFVCLYVTLKVCIARIQLMNIQYNTEQ